MAVTTYQGNVLPLYKTDISIITYYVYFLDAKNEQKYVSTTVCFGPT